MRIRWLGWAGVEIEEQGERVVVDPLNDVAAVFAWVGEAATTMPRPEVTAPKAGAVAGLVTHLHRDHADAAALTAALDAEATVYEPQGYGGSPSEQLAIAQADAELTAAELKRERTAPLDQRDNRSVHSDRAAGRRRHRRPAGVVADRGRP